MAWWRGASYQTAEAGPCETGEEKQKPYPESIAKGVVEMINPKPIEKFLTIKQVAVRLQLDYDTIRKYIDSKVIPPEKVVKLGGVVRIRESALIEL